MNIFQEILGCRSMTAIQYMVEDAWSTCTAEESIILEKIQNSNSLDEIWALCHEQLGNHEEAERLRTWLESKDRASFLGKVIDAECVEVPHNFGDRGDSSWKPGDGATHLVA